MDAVKHSNHITQVTHLSDWPSAGRCCHVARWHPGFLLRKKKLHSVCLMFQFLTALTVWTCSMQSTSRTSFALPEHSSHQFLSWGLSFQILCGDNRYFNIKSYIPTAGLCLELSQCFLHIKLFVLFYFNIIHLEKKVFMLNSFNLKQ